MDEAELEQLWAITIPALVLETGSPDVTYKAPLESAGTLFVPPPSSDSSIGSTEDLSGSNFSTLMPGVSAHVNLVRGDSDPAELARSAGYELREVIGQGGMGVVYRAHQASLRRDVAIKTIKEPGKGEPKFVSEARATGQLDHPNIVPVYDLGATSTGETILAMKLVEGASWKQVLHPTTEDEKARAERYELEDHLETLVQVANAVSFAHSRNLVHCDLKPENVMLGDFGEVLVMDWGLAVDVSEVRDPASTLVHRSMVKAPCGTPSYMPPELAAGEGNRISAQTDVYLLGAILVELLRGKPPHTGRKLSAVIYQAFLSHPPELEGVSDELRSIAHKALAREPKDRYASVIEFRDDLRGHIKHRESLLISDAARGRLDEAQLAPTSDAAYEGYSTAIAGFEQARLLWEGNAAASSGLTEARLAYAESALAHEDLRLAEAQLKQLGSEPAAQSLATRVSAAREERERAARSARAIRYSLVGAVAAILVGLAVGFVLVRGARDEAVANAQRAESNAEQAQSEFLRAEGERERAEAALAAAEQATLQSERELAGALIAQGTMLMTRQRYVRARETFLRAEALSARMGLPTLAAEIGRWQAERYAPDPPLRFAAPSKVTATAATDDRVWVGCEDGSLLEFDLLHGTELSRTAVAGGGVTSLVVAGDQLAVGTADGQLRLFSDGLEQHAEEAHEGAVLQLAFYETRRDEISQHLVSSGADAKLGVWQLPGLERMHTLEHPGGPASDFSCQWGGGYSRSADGRLNWWAYFRGALFWDRLPEPSRAKPIQSVAHSAWQPPDLRKSAIPQLVTASAGAITIWEWQDGSRDWKPGKQLVGHRAPIEDLVWMHDGTHFASVASDGELRVWTREGDLVRLLDGAGRGPLALTPRGFWLIARDGDSAVAWDLGLSHLEPSGVQRSPNALTLSVARPVARGAEAPPPPAVTSVALDSRGLWVAGGSEDGGVHLFDATSGQRIDTLRGHAGSVRGVHFTQPDAAGIPRLLSCGVDGSIREWRLTDTSGLPSGTWSTGVDRVSAVEWTANGAVLGDLAGGLVRLTEQVGDAPLRVELPSAPGPVTALAEQQGYLAVGCSNGSVSVWAVGQEQPVVQLTHPEPVSALAISVSGEALLVGDTMGGVVHYALPGGARLGALVAHSARVTALQFFGGGATSLGGAISVGEDGRACTWSLETYRESYLSPPAGPLADIAVSQNPLRVASACDQGLLLWNMSVSKADAVPDSSLIGRGVRMIEQHSLRAGADLLEEARAQGQAVPRLVLARAYWGLGYPAAAQRVLALTPPEEQSVEHQILVRAVGNAANAGSLLGFTGGRTRVLAPLEGSLLLSAGEMGDYEIWDLDTAQRLKSWGVTVSGRNLNEVSVSPDGSRIVGRDAWSRIRVWDREQTLLHEFVHKDAYRIRALSDSILVVTYTTAARVGYDGTVLETFDLGLADRERVDHFSSDVASDQCVIATRKGMCRVLRISDGELLSSFQFPEGELPNAVRCVPGGKQLLTYRRTRVSLRGLDGTVESSFDVGLEPIYVSSFDPQGQRLGWVDDQGYVRVRDLESGQTVVSATIDEWPMRVGFSRDGKTLVVGTMLGRLTAFPVPPRK